MSEHCHVRVVFPFNGIGAFSSGTDTRCSGVIRCPFIGVRHASRRRCWSVYIYGFAACGRRRRRRAFVIIAGTHETHALAHTCPIVRCGRTQRFETCRLTTQTIKKITTLSESHRRQNQHLQLRVKYTTSNGVMHSASRPFGVLLLASRRVWLCFLPIGAVMADFKAKLTALTPN